MKTIVQKSVVDPLGARFYIIFLHINKNGNAVSRYYDCGVM